MSIVKTNTVSLRWMIVLFCFLALAISFSARAALGLVMPVWVRELGWTNAFVSGAGAAALMVMACVAPLAGRLVDRYGPRDTLAFGLLATGIGSAVVASAHSQLVFVLGFSFLSAIGFGIVATHVVSTGVARLFDRHQGLAIGIATSGATAGQFVIVPLIALLLSQFSWRWSFAALAAGSLLLIPLLWRSVDSSAQLPTQVDESVKDRKLAGDVWHLLRQPTFHCLFWSFLLCGYTTAGIVETHLIPYASFCGFPPLPSATAYGVLSAVNLIGMVLAGWLADRMNRPMLLIAIYVVRALTFVMLMNVGTNYETLLLFAVAFGSVDYATVPVTASLVANRIGIDRMGLAMGMIAAGHAVGGALGAYSGGYIFDINTSYQLVWWSGVWLSVLAAAFVLPLGLRALRNPSCVA